jgi:hypothetical protein
MRNNPKVNYESLLIFPFTNPRPCCMIADMETNERTINHGDGHIDVEQLFGDVWAVVKCNYTIGDIEMTPKRPIEIVNASKACGQAYQLADDLLEDGKKELAAEALKAAGWMEERYARQYNDWQAIGGTSDIESIVIDALGAPAIVDTDGADNTVSGQWREHGYH